MSNFKETKKLAPFKSIRLEDLKRASLESPDFSSSEHRGALIFEKNANLVGGDDIFKKIFQVITTGWNNLGTVEKKEVLDLLEELIEGLKEYHNTYVGLKGASLRREYFDDVKKFQAAIMNADQREKIMHDAFLDKLNRLSRKMKEIGLDNSWRSNEEIWGITPDGKRNKPKFWMFKLFKESDWITKESGDDK